MKNPFCLSTCLGNGLYLNQNGSFSYYPPYEPPRERYEFYKVKPKYDFETGYKRREYIEGKDGLFHLIRDTGDR
jgi:hypothetical protein|tara:strand:- start:75 stop:296 length:222 start_codon:yes stop_codon:yes gene_type:complete